MWVYKITNIQNHKVYIGQTIRPITERVSRHFSDAINNRIDTKFARAIRKYGKDSFISEIIDEAYDREELTEKEYYWINKYDSLNNGYNSTNSLVKCGGNTYKNRTEEEMKITIEKLRKSKLGGSNPNAKKVKMFDLINETITIFNSQKECAIFLKLSSHMPISRRCSGKTKKSLNNQYQFEYYNE